MLLIPLLINLLIQFTNPLLRQEMAMIHTLKICNGCAIFLEHQKMNLAVRMDPPKVFEKERGLN